MTGPQLSALAGIVLSLLFSYVPQLQAWYSAKDSKTQSLIMLGMLVLVAVGVYGISCLAWWPGLTAITCDKQGIKDLIEAFVAALIANQATYTISPTPANHKISPQPAKPLPVPPIQA
jgi:hypothetical protein